MSKFLTQPVSRSGGGTALLCAFSMVQLVPQSADTFPLGGSTDVLRLRQGRS
jgi:hypothetical protein